MTGNHPTRTPWWEHTTTTANGEPCDETTTTTTPPTTTPASTTTTEQPPALTTSTTEQPTTATEQPTTTTEQPTTTEPETTTTVEPPAPITAAVSTPLPQVDAVVLAPPVSYHGTAVGLQALPHTGTTTATTLTIAGALIALSLLVTALANRQHRKNNP